MSEFAGIFHDPIALLALVLTIGVGVLVFFAGRGSNHPDREGHEKP